MKPWRRAAHDAVVSGSFASVLSTAALAASGEREAGSPFAPTNAISHWYWGEKAAHRDRASLKYTVFGYATHHTASIFWATLFERWFGERASRSATHALVGGASVSALACFVDYQLTPQRLRPGYEKRLSRRALAVVYGAFGLGLALHSLLRLQGHGRETKRLPRM